MGMAASQARFLGITARKTNTEYEGQQVNQQRTALANQSANLFNQMLALEVPVPPNKNDSEYTKTVYSFVDDTGAAATIESIVNNPDTTTSAQYPKVVKYTTVEQVPKSYRNSLASSVISNTKNEDGSGYTNKITVGSNAPVVISKIELNPTTYVDDEEYQKDAEALDKIKDTIKANTPGTDEEKAAAAKSGTKNLYKFTVGDNAYYVNVNASDIGLEPKVYSSEGEVLTAEQMAGLGLTGKAIEEQTSGGYKLGTYPLTPIDSIDDSGYPYAPSDVDKAYLKKIKETYAQLQDEEVFYKYTLSGVDYYIPESMTTGEFHGSDFALDKSNVQTNPPYGYYVTDVNQDIKKEYPADVTYDSSGRLQSIIIKDGDNVLNFSISVNSITDEEKYEDAMQQYKYDMAKYDKEIEDINAKTEAIQVQDRTLELRLKQLDTEQEALTQEMDAIKKVIDKNVETTFKTFA